MGFASLLCVRVHVCFLAQVHSYVAAPGGRTRYLSELASGEEVLVADAAGRTRTALVGRVKVERRPLVRGAWVRRGQPGGCHGFIVHED